MAVLGQAYDLRKASPATVAARAMRTGDIALTRRGATPLGATPLGATPLGAKPLGATKQE